MAALTPFRVMSKETLRPPTMEKTEKKPCFGGESFSFFSYLDSRFLMELL